MNTKKFNDSKLKSKLLQIHQLTEGLRDDANSPVDAAFHEVANEAVEGANYESFEAVMADLGVQTHTDTIQNLLTTQQVDAKWLVPEILRNYIKLGMSRAPIYPNITATEETIAANRVKVPQINQMDATPRWVGEGETIQLSEISYGSKEFKVRKMGRGIKLTDELKRWSSLQLVSLFLGDFGVRLGYGLDSLAINVLLNGEQADGSESAPVIGVATVNTLTYKDLLKVWLRLSRMGKNPTTMVGGEDMALEILDLPEYKRSNNNAAPVASLNMRTTVPTNSDFFIHSSVPSDEVVILDKATTMSKFNTMPLKVESERIVSNQTEATYVTLATGFATLFRDSRIVLDKSVAFATNPFPDYMNIDAMAVDTIV